MKHIRILLADNDPASLQTGSESLRQSGYQIIQADTPAMARQILKTAHIHLAILDLRLSNDSDESDRSGLRLAKETARELPKLIWTKFPTYQDVREALKPDSHNLPPAVDFVDKRLGIQELQGAVEETLAKHLTINWNLTIQHTGTQTLSQILDIVASEADENDISEHLIEFEDLLRTVFFTSRQITLGEILAYHENRVILPVFAYDEKGAEQQFVLLLGDRTVIDLEKEQFQATFPNNIQQKINYDVNVAYTNHFAALALEYFGGRLEDAESLSAYISHHTVTETTTVLRNLFEEYLRVWHGNNPSQSNQSDLQLFLQQWLELQPILKSVDGIHETIAGIHRSALARGLPRIEYQLQSITFHWLESESTMFLNPAFVWSQLKSIENSRVQWGTVHGRVTIDTVIVNPDNTTWMIDFIKAGNAPLLCDFVSLEMAIKLNILKTPSLYERYLLEERLLTATELDGLYSQDKLPDSVQTAFQFVRKIRHLAAQLAGCSLKSYQIGLVYYSLAQFSSYNPNIFYTRRAILPFVHALLTCAMNITKLLGEIQPSLPPQAMHSLWLDDVNKSVWVEGHQIDLSVQEFTILAYLYKNAGRLCERQEIIEKALGETFDELDLEQSRLNSAISRLRQKIEPDSQNPRYFLTVRGRGYKLDFQTLR